MEKVSIQVFSSPGCSKCKQARKMLQNIVEGFEENHFNWKEVNVLNELDYSAKMGIVSTPAIVIDDKLVFNKLPTPDELKTYLIKLLQNRAN